MLLRPSQRLVEDSAKQPVSATPHARSTQPVRAPDDLWASRTPGVYLLLLHLEAPATLAVGRLGAVPFPPGWYVYVGSALGGLGARLRRHATIEKRRHWHVDTLRAVSRLVAVALRPGRERVECETAGAVAALPGARIPAPRFGASDCRCAAHLLHFTTEPSLQLDERWHVVSLDGEGPIWTIVSPERSRRV